MEVLDYTREQLEKSNGIIIYGAGVWGKIVYETLQNWNITPQYFVDRFKCQSPNSHVPGQLPVLSPEEISAYLGHDVLICAPSAFEEVRTILEKKGFQKVYHVESLLKEAKPKTFENLQDRLPADKLSEIYSYYMYRSERCGGRLIIPQMSFSVSEACSLNCRKCNALMPYYHKPKIFSFEQYLPEMNRMLDIVDEIMEVGFIGGEAFLNRELYKYLDWAVGSEKIASVLIVTNSTIMPDERTIKSMKNDKVFLCLDNYGILSSRLKDLEEMAIKEKINYYILNNDYWYDFGGTEQKNYTMEQRTKVFYNCPMRDCHFFLKGNLYRCQIAGSLSNLGYYSGEGDCIDFNWQISRDDFREKLSYLLTRREPLMACDFCNDMECAKPIPVAVQDER